MSLRNPSAPGPSHAAARGPQALGSPVRRSERPGQAGRPGRAGQDESRQEDLQEAVSMAEARVNLDMRHALDRTRAASERELGRTPLVEELRRRRRADGVLGAVGPLGGRQAHGNPARWPRRALGSVARCRSMPASRGLLGPPGASWGLPGSPGASWGLLGSRRVPARLVEETAKWAEVVGGNCGRAGRAGARTGRAGT